MIEKNKRYGCLTVLDLGEEYSKSEEYFTYLKQSESLKKEIDSYIEKRERLIKENPILFEEIKQKIISDEAWSFQKNLRQLDDEIKKRKKRNSDIEEKLSTHYKCQCKCGEIVFYNTKTVESNPRYCYYPVPISTRSTYSTRASNATYHKKEKYKDLENVVLCDKSECLPSEEYCDNYNAYKNKQLEKKNEALRLKIAALPRVYAKNYDIDFTGKQYESLFIEGCCKEDEDCNLNCLKKIIKYKEYRCRCILCGKEQHIRCDSFGIYPPTEYGFRAYHGYWSRVSCDCHNVSSFQWIVNKLLFENNIPYLVEYSFPDLYGSFGVHPLRFDFAILNKDGSLKCLIECQGEQHYKPVKEFGWKKQYEIQQKNDELKREYVQKHNLQLIEISYKNKQYEAIETILKKNGVIR